jgi:hypothetical protein
MPPFADYFSEENIIEELCRARIKLAGKRHDAAFQHNITRTARAPHSIPPSDWGTISERIFPSRRVWHRYRPKRRRNEPAAEVNQRALYKAIMTLRGQTPQPAWAQGLEQITKRIRQRVLSTRPFRFRRPKIIALPKQPGGHVYRPLATYALEEKIIEGLTARYLRSSLDKTLLPSCMAFRCAKKNRRPPTTHDALRAILAIRARHPGQPLMVAECDIKGFFDCVGHRIARESLDDLIADATRQDPSLVIDPRAREIFDAYLQSYSFLNNVRGTAQRELHKRDPGGEFKWPEQDLHRLYHSQALPAIGVPQGGALSCLIANAVLHRADKAVAQLKRQHGKPLLYLRYCDDMILIATTTTTCTAAFAAYRRTLSDLLLPLHPPQAVGHYTKHFWEGKSKRPYEWSAIGIPWIQFVGYQVRYDALLRIRPSSLKKQVTTVTKTADGLLLALQRAHQQLGIRRTAREIQHRLRQKLISMSVGRINIGKTYQGPRPMCWAAGFRGLTGQACCNNQLKRLDRHRERQIQRVKRYLQTVPLPSPRWVRKGTEAHKYYGKPFSYAAQFR